MPIQFHPDQGMVLICDFNTGFQKPEMIKRRPVVVLSLRRRRQQQNTCIVVPLSTTAPHPIEPFHHRLDARSLPKPFAGKATWAKCDMIAHVGLARLDRVKAGRGKGGKRIYVSHRVTADDLKALQRGVLQALGLGHLTLNP